MTCIYIDATEREHYRPQNKDEQIALYSGKQGYHTIKNTIICDNTKRILFAGLSTQGSMHDFALFHHEFPEYRKGWFEGLTVVVDSGYLGFAKDYQAAKFVFLPYKRTKNKQLTKEQKEHNRFVAQTRVIVENAICGLKRFYSIVHRYRNRKSDFENTIIQIAAAICNFQLSTSSSLLFVVVIS